ncbi:MAG: hypothetical protein J0H22_00200 [Actinobacteria bacterium]|nr:hypothetical protein [Actinomycetota bacterium]
MGDVGRLGAVAAGWLGVALAVVVDVEGTVVVVRPADVACWALVEHPATAKVTAAAEMSVSFDIERSMTVLRRAIMSASRMR